jgi:predicted secreted acid phosphatase
MKNDPQVLGQYSDAPSAVAHCVKLVNSLLLTLLPDPDEKKDADAADTLKLLSECYTKNVVIKKNNSKLSGQTNGVAVFDIDDTVLLDDSSTTRNVTIPNSMIIELFKKLKHLNIEIHFVTARLRCDEMISETKKELEILGLEGLYDTLSLAPQNHRKNLATISLWKMNQRKKIAEKSNQCIILSVGDQWGDLIVIKSENDIKTFDDKYKSYNAPYIVVRSNDGVTLWGLKLPSN